MVAEARADVDDVQADAKLTSLDARLDAISKKVASPRIDEAGASKALADLTAVDAALDRLGAKDVKAQAGVGGVAEDTAKVDDLDARLDEFGRKRETATLNVDSAGAAAGMLAMAKWPAIIAGVGMALPVIPAGLAAVAAGAGVAGLAVASVSKALSDGIAASKQSGQASAQLAQTELSNATAVASATRAVADAKTQAAHDEITGAQQVASAEQSLANAQQQAAQDAISGAERVAQAEQSLQNAEQAEQQAQENLTQARADAVRTLQQLNNSQADAALQAQQAALDLQQAQQDQAATDASGTSTSLQKQQAALRVAEAQQRLTEAQQAATNTTQDANKANAEGVDGLPAVVSAQRAAAQAAQGTASAQQALSDASRAAASQQAKDAETVANAQKALASAQQQASWTQAKDAETVAAAVQNLNDTYKQQQLAAQAAAASGSNAAASFAKDMAGMTGAGRGVVDMLLQMKGDLKPLEDAAQGAVFPGLLTFLEGAQSLMPVVSGEVKSMGGIVGDAFAAAGKALADPAVQKNLKTVFDDGAQFLKIVLPALGGVAGAFLDMGAKGGPAVTGLGKGIAAILDGVGKLFAGLSDPKTSAALGQIFESIGKIIGSLGGPLGQAIGKLAQDLAPLFASMVGPVGQVANAIAKIIDEMPPGVVQALAAGILAIAAGVKLWALAQAILTPLLDASPIGLIALAVAALAIGIYELATHWSQVMTNIMNWSKDAADFITNIFDNVRHFFAHIGDDIAQPFIDGFNTVVGWLNSSGNAISGFFEALPGEIVGWLSSTGSIISAPFVDGFNIVVRYFEQLPGSLETIGRNALVGLADGVVSGWNSVYGFFSGIANSIAGFFTGLYNSMINAGYNLLVGLWNGLVSGFNALAGDFMSIPTDLINRFKSALGIASPSKVFHDIGLNVTQGFAQGVDGGSGQVRSAIDRMTSAVTAGAPRAGIAGGAAGVAGGGQQTLVIQPGAGGSGLEQQFWVWFKNGVRNMGGDPRILTQKVVLA